MHLRRSSGPSVVPPSRPRGEGPGGFTLIEVILVLALTAVVVPAIGSLASGTVAMVGRAGIRGERLDLVRTARVVLHRELRAGVPGRDWASPAGDSIPLRAFRGVGLPCGSGSSKETRYLYRGRRLPDPTKDSVLFLLRDGTWRAGALLASRPGAAGEDSCPGHTGNGGVLRIRTDEASGDVVLVRVYERGSYHLQAGALRYRRGRSGRQPLTATLLDAASQLGGDAGRGPVRLDLAFRGSGGVDRPTSWGLEIWPRDP